MLHKDGPCSQNMPKPKLYYYITYIWVAFLLDIMFFSKLNETVGRAEFYPSMLKFPVCGKDMNK